MVVHTCHFRESFLKSSLTGSLQILSRTFYCFDVTAAISALHQSDSFIDFIGFYINYSTTYKRYEIQSFNSKVNTIQYVNLRIIANVVIKIFGYEAKSSFHFEYQEYLGDITFRTQFRPHLL